MVHMAGWRDGVGGMPTEWAARLRMQRVRQRQRLPGRPGWRRCGDMCPRPSAISDACVRGVLTLLGCRIT